VVFLFSNASAAIDSRDRLLQAKNCTVLTKRFKSTLDVSKIPILDENDLEEQIIRGSGTHKSVNCILLIHRPTGRFISLNLER
jgi:hypothetical protein